MYVLTYGMYVLLATMQTFKKVLRNLRFHGNLDCIKSQQSQIFYCDICHTILPKNEVVFLGEVQYVDPKIEIYRH